MDFPVTVSVDTPERVANWRPLVHWIMAIPHFVVMYFVQLGSNIVWFLSFFAVLFTKNLPEGLYQFQAMAMRYQLRVFTYAGFLYEQYPPFQFDMVGPDPGGSPAMLSMPERPEEMNRWLVFVKWILAIPHFILLMIYGIGAFFAYIAAFFAVLFTGAFPEGIRDFVIGVARYGVRVNTYMMFMHDEYPAFGLQE